MARISKSGLDYFPLDVNFLQDRKVRRISSRHHAAGIAALDKGMEVKAVEFVKTGAEVYRRV